MIHFCFLTGLYSRHDPLMIERQGRCLVNNGFKVSYVVCDSADDEIVDGIHIISTGFEPKNRLQRFLYSKRKVYKKAVELDADVYQISDPELISLVLPLKQRGKKVIFNLREYYPDLIMQKTYIPVILRKHISSRYSRLMSEYLPNYDAVFTVTPQLVEFLNDRHHVSNSYLLTNYPIPNPVFSVSKDEYLNRPNVLLYEGSIYAVSRQEIVFDALSGIEGIQYLLAGRIEQGYDMIKKHKYWKSVIFYDGFTKDDLPEFFNRATIGNIIRDYGKLDGSLGVIKLFECMEAALPVLLSDVPLYRRLVEKYKCGICVNPNDAKSIREAVEYLIANKEIAYQMGQNGRKAVLEEFNWWNQSKLYIKVIKKILNL